MEIELSSILPTFDVLQPEDLDLAQGFFKRSVFQAEEYIQKPGRVCSSFWFIESGLVYAQAQDEQERVLWYEFEGSFFTDVVSFCEQIPSTMSIKAAENGTQVVLITYDDLQTLIRKYHAWAIWVVKYQQYELARLTRYYENLRIKDATERYHDLIAAYPELLQRVPLGNLASYLGISQVSLSRIRAGTQKK
ncbi:MAG: Crp/Fnr family transcriptional regulator [Bacteroidota bacterium]